MRSLTPKLCSFPRRQETSCERSSFWVPARAFASKRIAGMIGVLCVGCNSFQDTNFTDNKVVSDEKNKKQIVLMDSDFEGKDLIVGMSMQEVSKSLNFLGWNYSETIRLSSSAKTNLWLKEPCRAAAFEYSQNYKSISTERPPKNLILNATFYECVEGKPINMGQLAKVEVKEEI